MNKVLFWDFDGTLAYSRSLWNNALLRALRKREPESALVIDDIRPYMSKGFPWHRGGGGACGKPRRAG